MTNNFNKNFLESFLDVYKLGYNKGYQDCKYDMELKALKGVLKEDIAKIVKNSTKPFNEN